MSRNALYWREILGNKMLEAKKAYRDARQAPVDKKGVLKELPMSIAKDTLVILADELQNSDEPGSWELALFLRKGLL